MPELPEVETVARQLAPHLRGRVLRAIELLDVRLARRLKRTVARSVAGWRIRDVRRVGKQVGIELAPPGTRGAGGERRWLLVHLRMTGRLQWFPPPRRGTRCGATPALPHERARLLLDRGVVSFLDARRFGTVRLCDAAVALAVPGLDPLSRRFTVAALGALLAGSRQAIKVWLLRQDRLVGLGNIYASEILHAAGVHPRRRGGALQAAEVERLHAATRRILRHAIRRCGTTFSDFQDVRGSAGTYTALLAVYGRDGEPCPRCAGPVARLVQNGRSTFCCPACQRYRAPRQRPHARPRRPRRGD